MKRLAHFVRDNLNIIESKPNAMNVIALKSVLFRKKQAESKYKMFKKVKVVFCR